MRKAVVMLLTLALIAVLSLMVLRSSTVSESYLYDINKNIFDVQLNRTFLDISKIVQNSASKVNNAEEFAYLLKLPFAFHDEKSGIKAVLSLASNAGKFNINRLLDSQGKINALLYDILYAYLQDEDVYEPSLFLSFLLDALDKDDKERAYGSELAHTEDPPFEDGGVLSRSIFEKVLDIYAKRANDGKVLAFEWEKILTFSGDLVDFNYLNAKIKLILSRNYGINTPFENKLIKKDEDLSLNEEKKRVFRALGLKYYVPRLACELKFSYMKSSQNVKFVYDLQSRRISEIETIF